MAPKQSPLQSVASFGSSVGSFDCGNDHKAQLADEATAIQPLPGDHVYIRDKDFAWLPARVLSTAYDRKPNTVTVQVILPNDWRDCTVPSRSRTAQYDSIHLAERVIDLSTYANETLPRASIDEETGELMQKSDMADLPYLHEASILYSVKDRHAKHMPYTRVNDIVVAMNPFQWINRLYSKEKQVYYANQLIWNALLANPSASRDRVQELSNVAGSYFTKAGIAPHVYETSSLAYRGMAVDGEDQAILVSGESGAGKTETVKIVVSHLAMIQSMTPPSSLPSTPAASSYYSSDEEDEVGSRGRATGSTVYRQDMEESEKAEEDVVTKVLESTSIFEAFGNARTARNDNSSRFGKFTRLQFIAEGAQTINNDGKVLPRCKLVGCNSDTYLLEKSRVVAHDKGERTYHVFYQLLAAPEVHRREIWPGLVMLEKDDFKYAFNEGTHLQDSEEDATQWHTMIGDLALFGVRGSKLTSLMRALCIVLALGNLTFGPDKNNEERTVVTSRESLVRLAELMGIDARKISLALTTRTMSARGEDLHVFLNPSVAKDGCDALAKEIYARIFDFIVRTINNATCAEKLSGGKQCMTISLLDLFGFEAFEVNSFEQLCINYANEKLQQKYVTDNFRLVQDEYISEGIELFDLSLVDNKDRLEMLEGPMGIIMALNDECVRPNGNDSSFVYRIKTLHRSSKILIQKRLHRPYEFGVEHFAGPVTYDARNFVERNNDALPADLLKCASKTTNDLIRHEIKRANESQDKGKGGRKSFSATNTVGSKFRSQLVKMMKKIENTRTRYIRCIRPNKQKVPRITDHCSTMKQLTSAGLVTAITISRETFPDRLEYAVVIDRFRVLAPDAVRDASISEKQAVERLMAVGLKGVLVEVVGGLLRSPYACGKTKVYFRPGALERLESARAQFYGKWATLIQTRFRVVLGKKRRERIIRSGIMLQAYMRGLIARNAYVDKLRGVVVLQCWVRCMNATQEIFMLRLNHSALLVQTRYRMLSNKRRLMQWKRAAIVIQIWRKKANNKSKFAHSLAKCVEEARKDDQAKALARHLADIDEESVSPDVKKLTKNSEQMLEYYRTELYNLRRANSELQASASMLHDQHTKLAAVQTSFDAAIASNSRRIIQLGRSNQMIAADLAKEKQKSTALSRQLKHEEAIHEEEVSELRGKFEKEAVSRDCDKMKYKKEIEKLRFSAQRKAAKHEREIAKLRKAHSAEKAEMREELKVTKDRHNEYLSKLMDVLENAHSSRDAEVEALTDDYEEALTERDDEIARLKREVKTLKSLVAKLQGKRR